MIFLRVVKVCLIFLRVCSLFPLRRFVSFYPDRLWKVKCNKEYQRIWQTPTRLEDGLTVKTTKYLKVYFITEFTYVCKSISSNITRLYKIIVDYDQYRRWGTWKQPTGWFSYKSATHRVRCPLQNRTPRRVWCAMCVMYGVIRDEWVRKNDIYDISVIKS